METTNHEPSAENTNGAVSVTHPDPLASVYTKHSSSSLDIVYAGVSGFVTGFCIAAGVAVILFYWIKVTGGIDGE